MPSATRFWVVKLSTRLPAVEAAKVSSSQLPQVASLLMVYPVRPVPVQPGLLLDTPKVMAPAIRG